MYVNTWICGTFDHKNLPNDMEMKLVKVKCGVAMLQVDVSFIYSLVK